MSTPWARSGGMWLTGRADGSALEVEGDPAGAIEATLTTLPGLSTPDVSLLGERAAVLALRRQGTITAGGAGRMLPTADGWVALSLPRTADVELVPALVEGAADEPWTDIAKWAHRHTSNDVLARATMLGLPAAVVPESPQQPRRPGVLTTPGGHTRQPRPKPRVLDLSSLWAGPLCAHLLGLLGADVVKVESTRRPDGARYGHPEFFALLHAGHRSVAIDFTGPEDLATLRHLIARADLVIEASRPRALRHLGFHAEDCVAAGTRWLSITAYGRDSDDESRVGFGDDVAAGAGLVARDHDGPVFAGDALADPLTGVTAAAAAHTALSQPEARLIDVSMHDVARNSANRPQTATAEPPRPPRKRTPSGPAARIGAHNHEVVQQWV